jgi:hypothetical protein
VSSGAPRGEATPRRKCPHPRVGRELMHGYDVICGDCGDLVGVVALFPAAVLTRGEAKELLGMVGDVGEGSSVRAKLVRAAA